METKVCIKCNDEKSIEEFSWKNKKLNLKRARCKTCMRKHDNARYAEDENRRKKVRSTAITRNKWNREFVQRVKKKTKCCKCGEDRWYVLDLHHLENKEFEIGDLLRAGCSISKIKKEMRKCIVLCANCHREEHFLSGY